MFFETLVCSWGLFYTTYRLFNELWHWFNIFCMWHSLVMPLFINIIVESIVVRILSMYFGGLLLNTMEWDFSAKPKDSCVTYYGLFEFFKEFFLLGCHAYLI
jgi:hypothetical protein